MQVCFAENILPDKAIKCAGGFMERDKTEQNRKTENTDTVSQALMTIYSGVFCIDLLDDTYSIVRAPMEISAMLRKISSAQQAINLAIQKTVFEEEIVDMLSFVNLSTLPERMERMPLLSTEYQGILSGWVRGSFIECEREPDGSLRKVLYTYQVIDGQKREELSRMQAMKANYLLTERENRFKTNVLENEKKSLTDDLIFQNNFTKILMEQMNCGVLAYAIPGRKLLHINREALRIYGWRDFAEADRKLASNWTHVRLMNTEDGKKLRMLRKREGSVKYHFIEDEGTEHEKQIIAESKSLTGRHGGKVIISTFMDITHTLTLEEDKRSLTGERNALTAENTELNHAIDAVHSILNSGSYLCTYDSMGKELLGIKYSTALRKLYGYDGEEDFPDVWESWISCVHPEDREYVEKSYFEALEDHSGNTSYDVTYRSRRKDGEIRWQRVAGYVIRQENGAPITCYGLVMDIDEQKKTADRIEDALNQARLANEAKTSFLARMSHDIRTPLNGIQGLIEINEKHSKDVDFTTRNRRKAKVAADHLLALINDVLQLSKLEEPDIRLAHEPFNMMDMADDIFTIIEMKANENGITVTREADPDVYQYACVWGSPLHVRQIFINILGNAVKYNKKNGSIFTSMKAEKTGPGIVVFKTEMSDTGIGMSEEFLKHLYDPFAREHEEAGCGYEGTGLGMAIVKQLVDKMGGAIHVESRAGEGTCFTVEIPFETATENDVERLREENEPGNITGTRILLVDDNELNREIATTLLSDAGAEITEALNGKQAVEIFSENRPGTFDVILMDVMMPVMNGYEATRRIRGLEREDAGKIPVIAMTANAFAEDIDKAKKAGMNAHLSKPLDVPKMLALIARYTTKHTG